MKESFPLPPPLLPLLPLQISLIFLLGALLVLLPAAAPYQSRVQATTFGVMYALQVGGLVYCRRVDLFIWPLG